MPRTLAVRSKKISTDAIAAAALVGSLLIAGSAQAASGPGAPPVPQQPAGKIMSASGVNERMYPSTDSAVRGIMARGAKITLRCKVRAQTIGGTNVWYLLGNRNTWVSAAYIGSAGAGTVPLCKDVDRTPQGNAPGARSAMG
ncbi:SH3 domain-containing protein [Streptomyces sp. NPDC008001]|uniref:SH3 domain-containing protein n=1 Tax=Streptomyces sp. NPDC008001 TaxID=3364804 RepID=UPI0036EF4C09